MSDPAISFLDAQIRLELAFSHLCEVLEILVKQNAELIDLLAGDPDGGGMGADPDQPTHDLAGKPIRIR